MSHILIVVARRYNGHELWTALGILQSRGHTFRIVSTEKVIMDEVTFQRNKIEYTLDEVPSLNGHNALMFVSGNMKDTEAYWKDSRTQSYVDEAIKANVPIAAICCSVPTIRKAARGKRVSFFPLLRSAELLRSAGAILSNVSVSVDGNLVTAEHQMATQLWADSFADVLEGKPPEIVLVDSGFKPPLKKRRDPPELTRLKEISASTGRTKL